MTHEMRLERSIDASPEVVFDAFTDPALQKELHGADQAGWTVHRAETDVRVGGTSTYVMGQQDQEPDTETRVYSVVDRPRRLVFRHSMQVAEWGRTVETEIVITFEEQDGKTLLTMVQTGFDTVDERDSFLGGWPSYLDTLQRVIGDQLKTRHDSDG